uniref:Cytochrome c6 n=1 Tax=Kumanoa americana TaxID=1196377 RepID=A0A1C9CGM1_9FLOR|nr:cytochrome c553 [Kumanoa americana]AOM67548.1 cytochrome c553 [Kumanoa americana]
MNKYFSAVGIVTIATIINFANSVYAETNIEAGEQIFNANCAACHSGGNNVIVPDKNLKKDTLEENKMYSINAITNQVTNGKNAMPAFGARLSDDDINNVANYVLSQAEQNWSN